MSPTPRMTIAIAIVTLALALLLSPCGAQPSPQYPTPMFLEDQPQTTIPLAPSQSKYSFNYTMTSYANTTTVMWTNASDITVGYYYVGQWLTLESLTGSTQYRPTVMMPVTGQYGSALMQYCRSLSTSGTDCTVTITITNTATNNTIIAYSVYQMPTIHSNSMLTDSVNRFGWQYYALYLTSGDLEVLFSLLPDTSPNDQSVDLYLSSEFNMTNKLNFIFPNVQGKGSGAAWYVHQYYTSENVLLNNDYFNEGLYLIGVFCPGDVIADTSSYTLLVQSQWGSNQSSITASLFGIIGALIIVVLCLFAVAAFYARRRRAYVREYNEAMAMAVIEASNGLTRLDGSTVIIGPNGRLIVTVQPVTARPVPQGVPKEQIDALPRHIYAKPSLIDAGEDECDTRCTVCLEDYIDQVTELKALPCGHRFDVACIDKWLGEHKHCPLCNQNIDEAHDLQQHHHTNKTQSSAGNDKSTGLSTNTTVNRPSESHDNLTHPSINVPHSPSPVQYELELQTVGSASRSNDVTMEERKESC